MLRKIFFSFTFLSLLIVPSVFAQERGKGRGNGQDESGKPSDKGDVQVESVEEKGEMQGENKKLDIKVTDGQPPAVGQEEEEKIDVRGKGRGQRGVQSDKGMQAINEHASQVAQHVQALLNDPELEGGIGKQVREVAQAQNQAQEQIREHARAIEARGPMMKFFFGSNQQAVKGLEKQLEENQDRLSKLEELDDEAPTKEARAKIEAAETALEEQNEALDQAIAAEKQIRGIFGQLLSIFR